MKGETEAQVIGAAIAAFYENSMRCYAIGATPPKCQVIPAITMSAVTPSFYSIVVTEKLLQCLLTGTYPSEKTVVLKYVPPVRSPLEYMSFGIRPLENRRPVFQCFEAFKSLIECPSKNLLTVCPSSNLLPVMQY